MSFISLKTFTFTPLNLANLYHHILRSLTRPIKFHPDSTLTQPNKFDISVDKFLKLLKISVEYTVIVLNPVRFKIFVSNYEIFSFLFIID